MSEQFASHHGEPDWLREARETFEQSLMTFEDVAEVTRRMLSEAATGLPRLVEVLGRRKPPEQREAELEAAKNHSAIAGREVEASFQTLQYSGVVLHWASLETFVHDVLVGAILEDPSCISSEVLERVKITLADALSLDEFERAFRVVSLLEQHVRADLRAGVSRFEPLLALAGLGGQVRDSATQPLFEMHKMRNLIAHRRGRVDSRFADDLPWLEVEVGEQIQVTPSRYIELLQAAVDYAYTVHARATRHFGGSPMPDWGDLTGDPWMSVDQNASGSEGH